MTAALSGLGSRRDMDEIFHCERCKKRQPFTKLWIDESLSCKVCGTKRQPPAAAAPPTLEQQVRARQAHQAEVRRFLGLAHAMTNDEIDVCAARLADWIAAGRDQLTESSLRYKGALLVAFRDLRQSQSLRPHALARAKAWLDETLRSRSGRPVGEALIDATATFALHAPMDETEAGGAGDATDVVLQLLNE